MANNVAVVEKTFDLLRELDGADAPVGLKEISKKVGMPKPTAHRILQTLVSLGYVEQDVDANRYILTPQLSRLGQRQTGDLLISRALPYMEALNQRFDETVNLGCLQGTYVYYLHYIETTKALRLAMQPGVRDLFHSTALGRAIAAYLEPSHLDRLLRATTFQPRTQNTVASRQALAAILDRTAAQGWAEESEENDIGVACFGVPLMEGGRAVGSISVSVPSSRLAPPLRDALIGALLDVRSAYAEEVDRCHAS